jgi:cytoskeletal protein CcmA (bactofilin family)
LFVDGQVEGKLELAGGSVTVGPNAKIKADISAREVIVRGRVFGKLCGRERVQLWSTAHVEGEVQTDRLAIEDGALFRGKVEAGKAQTKSKEAHASLTSASGATVANSTPVNTGRATV